MIGIFQKIRSIESISFVGLFALLLNIATLQNPWLGFIGFLTYIFPLSVIIGRKLFTGSKIENFYFGLMFIVCEIIIGGTLIYYLYQITALISFLLLLLPLVTAFFIKYKKTDTSPSHSVFSSIQTCLKNCKPKSYIIPASIFGLDIFLLIYLFTHRTYDLSASPWQQITPLFFLIYTLTTLLLFFQYKKSSEGTNIVLTSLHFFVGLSVAALIYPLGYGFDAFIHRATEEWIKLNSFIAPKQPYYIGQYSLITWLSQISQIKIFFLDVFLVPILSAIFLPPIIFSTLKKITPQDSLPRQIAFWIIPFIPFLSLHLTTPHNLVLFFTLILIFLLFSFTTGSIPFVLPLVVSIAALLTHPLIGVPGFLFTIAIFLLKKFEDRKRFVIAILFTTFFSLCILLPVLFTLNGLRVGQNFPELNNPFTHGSTFLDLFKRPYWYAQSSPLYFEILYLFERIIAPLVILLAAFGFYVYQKKNYSKILWMFPLAGLGLFLDAWLLRSWIVFPDVAIYEQGDYPLRLIRTSIIFLLPFAMYGFYQLYEKILSFRAKWRYISSGIIIILISITLTLSLYLSYPQRNVKVRFPGYNVTQSDFKAVEWIHTQNSDYNYIVLSNQLVSAAALTNYSFAKYFDTPQGQIFYYAIPTGGVLYQYYGKMIYEGQKQEYMQDAMDVVGVKKAYFIVNKYWANSNKIIEEAKETADTFLVFDDKIWVFEYRK